MWTDSQKALAARACSAAGISDEHRKLILRQFPRSLFDRNGKAAPDPSSTSMKLNQSDFEHFMAIVERASGGRVLIKDRDGQFLYGPGHWAAKAADETQRQRELVTRIYDTLVLEDLLEGGGVGLAGWIRERVTGGRTDLLEELELHEIGNLIEGLKAFAKRHGIVAWRSMQEAAHG